MSSLRDHSIEAGISAGMLSAEARAFVPKQQQQPLATTEEKKSDPFSAFKKAMEPPVVTTPTTGSSGTSSINSTGLTSSSGGSSMGSLNSPGTSQQPFRQQQHYHPPPPPQPPSTVQYVIATPGKALPKPKSMTTTASSTAPSSLPLPFYPASAGAGESQPQPQSEYSPSPSGTGGYVPTAAGWYGPTGAGVPPQRYNQSYGPPRGRGGYSQQYNHNNTNGYYGNHNKYHPSQAGGYYPHNQQLQPAALLSSGGAVEPACYDDTMWTPLYLGNLEHVTGAPDVISIARAIADHTQTPVLSSMEDVNLGKHKGFAILWTSTVKAQEVVASLNSMFDNFSPELLKMVAPSIRPLVHPRKVKIELVGKPKSVFKEALRKCRQATWNHPPRQDVTSAVGTTVKKSGDEAELSLEEKAQQEAEELKNEVQELVCSCCGQTWQVVHPGTGCFIEKDNEEEQGAEGE